ncbi:MAG: zinc ribbon domain-containing protein [Gemmatimonadales bacterium]
MTDQLQRFARVLVERLRETPGGADRPVTLQELRSKVVPYRACRVILGFDSAEDYDVVVLRLVAEERGYARTLPELAAERCRAEAAAPAPDVTLLDQLADVTVQIGAEALDRIFGESVPAAAPRAARSDLDIIERHLELESPEPIEAPPPAPVRPPPPSPPAPPPRPQRVEPPAPVASPRPPAAPRAPQGPPPRPTREPAPRMAAPSASAQACGACRQPLPAGRQVIFCPWCGARVVPFTCPKCHTELESDWHHCITCGTAVKDPYRFV